MKYTKPKVVPLALAVDAVKSSVPKPNKHPDNPRATSGPPAYEADE